MTELPESNDGKSVSSDDLRVSPDDLLPLRDTPDPISHQGTPGPDYRGPVSTPAFYIGVPNQDAEQGGLLYDQLWPDQNRTFSHHRIARNRKKYDSFLYQTTQNFPSGRLTNMTSPTYEGLFDRYKNMYGRNNSFDKSLKYTCQTPGELALIRGWNRNTGRCDITGTAEPPMTAPATSDTTFAVTQAFPVGRPLFTRCRTMAVHDYGKPLYREERTTNTATQMLPTSPRTFKDTYFRKTENCQSPRSTGITNDHFVTRRTRGNYLSHMVRARREEIQPCQSRHLERQVALPQISVVPTLLKELKSPERATQDKRIKSYERGQIYNSSKKHYTITGFSNGELGFSSLNSGERGEVERIPKRCVLCPPAFQTKA